MARAAGLEPTLPFGKQILSLIQHDIATFLYILYLFIFNALFVFKLL